MPVSSTRSILDNPTDRQILAELQARSQRHVEELEVDFKEAGTVKIFSIYPFSLKVPLGGLGEFTIPACEEGRAYSKPLEIWRHFPEGRATENINKMRLALLDGWAVAEGIVGSGKFTTQSSDLRQFGVLVCGGEFTIKHKDGHTEVILGSEAKATLKKIKDQGGVASIVNARKVTQVAIQAVRKNGDERKEEEIREDILAGNLLTEAELDYMHKRLDVTKTLLVDEGNAYFQSDALKDITKNHRWAAIATGNEELPWVKPVLIKTKCDACKSPVDPEAIFCLACGNVFDQAKVIAKRLPNYRHLWDPTHPLYQSSNGAKAEKGEGKRGAAEK